MQLVNKYHYRDRLLVGAPALYPVLVLFFQHELPPLYSPHSNDTFSPTVLFLFFLASWLMEPAATVRRFLRGR